MKRTIGLSLVVVIIVASVTYTLQRSPIPAPVSGEEPAASLPTVDADALALMAQLTAQTQSAAYVVPTSKGALVTVEPNEQEELRAIDAYATTERQKIETWYSDQVTGLKVQLEQRVQTLSDTDKLAWVQFYQRANETWSTTGGRSETTTTGDPAGEYAAILARIKDSKQMTQQDFVNAQIGLAWMRGDKLAAVQREVDRRKAMITLRKPHTPTKIAPKQTKNPIPKVEAIMGGADNQFRALIGDALMSEGSVVRGYRVRKILAGSVEFEKNGKTWVQKVN
jgi:hypothetical protein